MWPLFLYGLQLETVLFRVLDYGLIDD